MRKSSGEPPEFAPQHEPAHELDPAALGSSTRRPLPAVEARWGTLLRRILPYLALVVLAFLAYANTLHHPFVYDDSHIARSPLLHDPWNLRAIWNGDFYGPRKPALSLYRPLADWGDLLNVRLNEIVFGDALRPLGFHLVDILMHAAVSCLMFAWLRRLRLATAVCLIATLFFCVHPVHTETVACTINRSDAQASIFGLAFLITHARRVPVVPALMYLCAMWSKESAVAFFPLAVAMDALVPPQGARKRWPLGAYGLLAAALGLWFWLRAGALAGIPTNPTFQENPLQIASALDRCLTAGVVQLRYLRLLCLPIGLSSDYSYDEIPTVHGFSDPAALGFIALLIAAIALAWKLRARMPAVTLAILGYAILFSTTSNFLVPIGTIMAERLVYMPSILYCALAGIALWRLRGIVGERAIAVAVGIACAACVWLTIQRNETWSDNLTFYREQVRTAPHSAKAHGNLALAWVEAGDDRAAIVEYQRALEILPFYPRTYYLLGNALHRLKEDPEQIIYAYRQAILVDPKHTDARVNLALTLIELERYDEARVVIGELRALEPQHPWLADLEKRLSGK
jgi:hypothetical protein